MTIEAVNGWTERPWWMVETLAPLPPQLWRGASTVPSVIRYLDDGRGDRAARDIDLAIISGASGRVDGGPSVKGLTLHTTYLSDRMWILRPFGEGASLAARSMDEFVVLRRTETRSVVDRRGLIADGQLKPPDDEGIRYGKLLFGETLSDYGGWSDEAMKQAKMDRLTKF